MKLFSNKVVAFILTIVMCLSSIAFVNAEDNSAIAIAAEGTTEISFDNAIAKDTDTGEGHYKFYGNSYATVKVDVEETGYYTMNVNILTRDQIENGWNVYIDDVLDGTFYTWLASPIWFDGEALDLYLTEGEHTIKIQCTKGNAYNDGFTLTRKEIDYKAQWIKGSTGVGNGTVTWERYVLDNAQNKNQYADYVVNVEEAGKYEISLQHSYNNSVINSAILTVNGGQEKAVSLPALERGVRGDEHKLTVLGEVNLVEGDNTIRIMNKDVPNGAQFIVDMIKVDKVADSGASNPSVSVGETIRIPMNSYTDSSSELMEFEGLYMLFEGDWAEFDFDAKTAGKYTVGMKFGGSVGDSQRIKVYVNSNEQLDVTKTVANDYFEPADVELGEITISNSGSNKIKFENKSITDVWVEDIYITLTEIMADATPAPTAAPTLAPTAAPTEGPVVEPMGENIRIQMREYIAAYNATNGGAFLRQDGSNPDNTLWQINDWAEYKLNISTPGTYELGLCIGGNAANIQKLVASVDGVDQLVADITIAETMGGSIPKMDVVFGNVTFATTGEHILKIRKTDGGFIYSSHIFLNLTDSSEIRIPTGSFFEANSSRKPGTLDYEGGYYCLRPGDWAKYNVFIQTPGKYKLGIKESGNTGQTAKLKAYVNGEEQFNNDSKTPLSGMWTSFADVEYGEVLFKYSGENTLMIENTGSSDGEYTVDIFLVLVEELDAGADIPDVPETKEIRLHMANDSYDRYCNLTNTDVLKIEGGCVTWHGKDAASEIGDWAKFKLNIEDPGTYRVGLELSGSVGASTGLYVKATKEGDDSYSQSFGSSQSIVTYYGTLTDTVFGTLEFPEAGEYDIYVEHKGSAGQYVGHLFFTHLGDDISINSAFAGEVDLAEVDVPMVPSSADVIMVNFSKKILEADITGKDCKISLKDSKGAEISFSPSVVKASAVLALKESLKPNEKYTLTIGNVADSLENSTLTPVSYVFETYEDEGVAFIREVKVNEISRSKRQVSATMFSSQNVGIKGRNYEIYLKDTDGNISSSPIASGLSGENGLIEFTYEIPSSATDGVYSFIVKGEYVATDATIDFIYVSAELADKILIELNAAADADEVKEILLANKDYIGADAEKIVRDVNEEKVYGRFLGIDVESVDDINGLLNKFVAIEKIAGATSSSIKGLINDEKVWNALGFDKELYDCLSNGSESESQANALEAIMDMNHNANTEDWLEEFRMIFDDILAQHFNKPQNVSLNASDLTSYVGQGVDIEIDFIEDCTEVSDVVLVISSDDASIVNSADIVLKAKGTYTKVIENSKAYFHISFANTVSDKIGSVMITAPNAVSKYDISLSGEIVYAPSEINQSITTNINEKDITLTTKAKSSGSSGGVNSSTSTRPSGSSKPSSGGSSGGTTVKPTPSVTEYSYIDIAKEHWAYPAVSSLLSKAILDKTADKLFNPEKAITREEVVKMMVLALGLTDEKAESKLKDVEKTNPYYKYIASAEKNGLITGDDEGNFMIGACITREDLCVILHRATKNVLTYNKTDEIFADDDIISNYAKDAVYNMRGINIINGMGDNLFAPKGNVTKAQAAKMIYEIVEAVK